MRQGAIDEANHQTVRHVPSRPQLKRGSLGSRDMSQTRTACIVAVTIASIACGTPEPPSLAIAIADEDSAIGCWQLEGLDWQGPFLPGSLLIRLDTNRIETYDSYRNLSVQTADSALRSRARFGAWAPYQGVDSVFAVVSDGFSGLQFRLTLDAESLRGRAYSFTDVAHFRGGGKVRGWRRSCEAAA